MARREWADKKALKFWHEHRGRLSDYGAKLLMMEHARAVRIIKKRKKAAYFDKDGMSADQFDAYIAALDDVYSDVMKGRL